MYRIMTVTLAALLLGGCATASIKPPSQKQVNLVLTKCPVLQNYTKSQLERAAAEIKIMPSDAQVTAMITEYSKLRQACRVMTKKLKAQN